MIKMFKGILSKTNKIKIQPMCFSCNNSGCKTRINNSKEDKCFENGNALYCENYVRN